VTRDAYDALEQLAAAVDAISVNLVDIERDPTLALLRHATLRGASAREWDDARAALDHLFEWYPKLIDVVDRAQRLRGGRTKLAPAVEAEVDGLVRGASISLSDADAPLGARDLLAGRASPERCTPTDLLARMSEAFDRAQDVIAGIARVWNDLTPQLLDLRRRAEAAADHARAIGGNAAPNLTATQRRIANLAEQVLADPLAADRREVDRVGGDLDACERALQHADEFRREIAGHLARARTLLDELEATLRDRDTAREHTRTRISGSDLPQPVPTDPTLEADLRRIADDAHAGNGANVEPALTAWCARATALVERARADLLANQEPVAARNELRGRLEAFRAKADGIGASERPALAAIYREAHAVLYTAPTELTIARELVGRYARELSGCITGEVPR